MFIKQTRLATGLPRAMLSPAIAPVNRLKVKDFGLTPPLFKNGHRVEAPVSGFKPVLLEILMCGHGEVAALALRDTFLGIPKLGATTGFDFNEDEHVAFAANQVNLARFGDHIAGKNFKSFCTQKGGRKRLAFVPGFSPGGFHTTDQACTYSLRSVPHTARALREFFAGQRRQLQWPKR